jgi:HAD superfamily hydrolase (TIGR01484 family)
MRYHALAVDYDGTLAHDGVIDETTAAALQRLKKSGRQLLMVTGRELEELLGICPQIELFDRIVAENGGLIYEPATKELRVLADPPPEQLIQELHRRGVKLLSVGRVLVATVEPYHTAALAAIHDLGFEFQVIFNKGSVMLLPSGVNKATGLSAALAEVSLSRHNVVGAGDAENDHAFLHLCECAVAVANALPTLKERADLVTAGSHGAGVTELINGLLTDELAAVAPKLARHAIPLGIRDDGGTEAIDPYRAGVMVCGTSGSGKSTITTGLLERLASAGYQFVTLDPEGDYSSLEFAVSLGNPTREPAVEEVLDVLRDPARNVVVNLLGVALARRPSYCDELLPRLLEMRSRTGRPHWIVIDEAHHLLPASWQPSAKTLPAEMGGALYITVHPGSVSRGILDTVNVLLAVGSKPDRTVREFCETVEQPGPPVPWSGNLASGDAVLWRPGTGAAVLVHTERPKTERTRHSRKYTEGNLGPDRSFYFRGPQGKLHLKASNLFLFLQMAEGVDDDTWEFHRRKQDYSRWFQKQIKDTELAEAVATIESDTSLSAQDSRAATRAAIESRYTLPADKPSGVID